MREPSVSVKVLLPLIVDVSSSSSCTLISSCMGLVADIRSTVISVATTLACSVSSNRCENMFFSAAHDAVSATRRIHRSAAPVEFMLLLWSVCLRTVLYVDEYVFVMLGFRFGCSLEIMRLIKSFAVALDDFVPVFEW